jgi:hypothetical protein
LKTISTFSMSLMLAAGFAADDDEVGVFAGGDGAYGCLTAQVGGAV